MKLFGLIVAVALALGIVASVVAEEKKDETPAATQPTTQAAKLAKMFVENFKTLADQTSAHVGAAGPKC